MHSATYHGHQFHYNGDYSGNIKIWDDETGVEFKKSFKELTITALYDNLELPFTQAARTFVAFAAVREGISRLEQMDPDDILKNTWLQGILAEMESK